MARAATLILSIASLSKANAMPNLVARVSAGKWRRCREFRLAKDCRKSKLSIRSCWPAETVVGCNTGKKSRYPQPLPELALPKACDVERE
jgi:hypothetical protein